LVLILPAIVELTDSVTIDTWDQLSNRFRGELGIIALVSRHFKCFSSHYIDGIMIDRVNSVQRNDGSGFGKLGGWEVADGTSMKL
jgi:hypothetical protein